MPENNSPPADPAAPADPADPAASTIDVSKTESNQDSRAAILAEIGKQRNSKAILFVTGDRPGMETQISPDVVDLFADHLDKMWPATKISLVLYTGGGNTATAWELINLLRIFSEELEIIVLSKAQSAGTMMCLGANNIVMTKQATMGPIDPSLNGPLNPQIPGGMPNHRAPVSVEAVQGFLDIAKEIGINDSQSLSSLLSGLSGQIHPLVLGQIFRTRTQIRGLAKKLLSNQDISDDKKEGIISFLCSESGSHDHTINRREAKELGLIVENPSQDFYEILRELYESVSTTLKLRNKFNADTELAGRSIVRYEVRRSLLESVEHGSDQFMSEGILERLAITQPGQPNSFGIKDNRTFEGWKREK